MRVLPNKAKTQRFCHQPPFRGNRTTTAKRVAYLRYDMGTSAAHAEAPLPAAAPEPMGRVDRGGCPPRPPSDLSFTHISLLTEVLTVINLAAIFHNTVHLFELSD